MELTARLSQVSQDCELVQERVGQLDREGEAKEGDSLHRGLLDNTAQDMDKEGSSKNVLM